MKKITVKDVMEMCHCSEATAKRIRRYWRQKLELGRNEPILDCHLTGL